MAQPASCKPWLGIMKSTAQHIHQRIIAMSKINYKTRIITFSDSYDFEHDKRYLIPFINGSLIGFVNKGMEIVLPAKYEIVLDDFDYEFSLVRIGSYFPVLINNEKGGSHTYLHKRYGLMNAFGDVILPVVFEGLAKSYYGSCNTFTARSLKKGYAVFSEDGNMIVPFGRYDYIDGFDSGYSRVKKGARGSLEHPDDKWGIIDETGKEVLPVEYTHVEPFYHKNLEFCIVEKQDIRQEFNLREGILQYEGAYQYEIDCMKQEQEDYETLCRYRETQSDVENRWKDDFPMDEML